LSEQIHNPARVVAECLPLERAQARPAHFVGAQAAGNYRLARINASVMRADLHHRRRVPEVRTLLLFHVEVRAGHLHPGESQSSNDFHITRRWIRAVLSKK
jgi:hypothetical protein